MARRDFVTLGLLLICVIVMLFFKRLFKKRVKEGFIVCPVNTYTNTGNAPCISCGANSSGPAGSMNNGNCRCNIGYYGYLGNPPCTACPQGSTSVSGSTAASSCVCPANNYILNNTCTTCPTTNVASCSTSGFTCNPGYERVDTACQQKTCAVNQYLNGSSCMACSGGRTSPSGSTSASACVCPANKYFNGTSCITCPANATCTSTGFTCNSGFFKSGLSCAPCAAGTSSAAGSTCTPCAAGTSSSAGSTCTPCAAGSFSGASATSCTSCGAGTYSAAGSSSCTTCPSNASCLTTGFTCNPGFSNAGTTCEIITCPAGKYLNGSTCETCPAGLTSSSGSTSSTDCKPCKESEYLSGSTCISCPQGKTSDIGSTSLSSCKCIPLIKPPNTQGSDQAILSASIMNTATNCPGNTFNYKNSAGLIQQTNPCTNSFYDFDQQKCVNAVGENVGAGLQIPCSPSTVYSTATNACVPVRTIVKPGDFQLINTTGSPGPGDFTGCKTVDQGDCTIVFKDSLGNPITANPCTATNQLYNFATKTCVAKTKACCNYTDPMKAAADKSCAADTSLIITKNAALCPASSRALCCNNAYATNTTCIRSNFWRPSYQFTTANRAKCAAGFQDYQGMYLLNQRSAKMNRKI